MPKLFARCRSAHKPLAVLTIDIDHLKRINDAHGYAVGDHVLKEIVNRATIALRPLDLVARMSGEEFAVVMPERDLDTALQTAERVRGRIGDTLVEGGDARCRLPSRSASARPLHSPTGRKSRGARSGGRHGALQSQEGRRQPCDGRPGDQLIIATVPTPSALRRPGLSSPLPTLARLAPRVALLWYRRAGQRSASLKNEIVRCRDPRPAYRGVHIRISGGAVP